MYRSRFLDLKEGAGGSGRIRWPVVSSSGFLIFISIHFFYFNFIFFENYHFALPVVPPPPCKKACALSLLLVVTQTLELGPKSDECWFTAIREGPWSVREGWREGNSLNYRIAAFREGPWRVREELREGLMRAMILPQSVKDTWRVTWRCFLYQIVRQSP